MKNEWISVTQRTEPNHADYDKIIINWVNFERGKPKFGIDIIDSDASFVDYKTDNGRTIFRWEPLTKEAIILPNEVTDEDSLFEYLKVIGI